MPIETEAPGGPAPLAPPRQAFIERSHQRSEALGLKRHEKCGLDPLIRSDLNLARERNHRLYTHAAPVMQLLYEQIVNTESMIVLTDAQGTILHAVGDDSFLARAHRVALAPGENWAEHAKGTNAIGTALFEEAPTLVHGGEHFMHANSFLTCSAAPIFDPRGNMLGVLDVTGDHRGYHQHTMGLVRMSARMIENHWLSDDYNNRLRLHFHSRPEFIGTLLEGILVVSPEGRLLGANRAALDQLGMSGAELRSRSLSSLFGTTPAAVYDHFRMPLSPPMQLCLPTGQSFFVSARFDWPSRPVVAGLRGRDDLGDVGDVADATPTRAAPMQEAAWGGDPAGRVADDAEAGGGLRFSGLQYLRTGDPQLETVIQKVRRVLDRGIPLLILGETGTGKELLARAVHHDSNRSRQPFVAVNCASIPESLIEAELFGYEEGAFTGARRKGAPGRLVQANGGTLFLDEIGDMPLPLQARLLRALQERSVTPLGSTKSIAVDIAVIGATHRNLRDMIAAQSFREDLYYRLNGLALRLPALRERTDLEAIVRRILQAERPQDPPELSPQVLAMFRRYSWPGNIRQLANVLRTAAVMSAGERFVTAAHLSDDFLEDIQRSIGGLTPAPGPAPLPAAFPAPAPLPPAWSAPEVAPAPPVAFAVAEPAAARTLGQAEIDMIRATLDAVGGNISLASKQLGISRNTIYRKLRWNPPGDA
ncbi:sigma-54-dependent Fis family transcriptional regulator [Pelomonas sp. P7]|uniref:Sigma-54-dependent Fis family transcriptional regulator n=1 Tax=Pelomonas caseinilytica TaxID=2906763 RepID=A0ABS8XPD2_9BURK|nr:sigma-54-dependent Fis family transcriptional regulator [Pelomonas sp. P7]MCE4539070.1 sigma-54-dependent Fis family transcriptional regulator [Pelomonas sp. P7]